MQARARFAPGARRYAGILLDVLVDHVLARDWARFHAETLDAFAQRAAQDVAQAAAWFENAGQAAPAAQPFAALLRSYREAAGIERVFARIAPRLSRPQDLLAAAAGWTAQLDPLSGDTPRLLAELAAAGARYAAQLRGEAGLPE